MGRYLEILRRKPTECEISEISEIAHVQSSPDKQQREFSRLIRIFRTLERRCPLHVNPTDWQQAVGDGRKFLASWGEQAEALGWTARDLFGLHPVPSRPAANYRRLSRYDETGLIWLLRERPVVALTETTAAIQGATTVLIYRKHRKPALGPLADSLDDLAAESPSTLWRASDAADSEQT